jgi:hypothetical protein
LLSDASGFPSTAPIQPAVWKRWPELAQDLTAWLDGHIAKCGASANCRKAAEQLAKVDGVRGNAVEFKLPDGRALQYLRATSRSKGKGVLHPAPAWEQEGADVAPDQLRIDLWRIAAEDGPVRRLRLKDGWFSQTELIDPYCESQCSGGWTGRPEAFAAHGRTFIFGAYQGGTTSGYVFLELMPTELKWVGSYRWGS